MTAIGWPSEELRASFVGPTLCLRTAFCYPPALFRADTDADWFAVGMPSGRELEQKSSPVMNWLVLGEIADYSPFSVKSLVM